MEPELDGEPVGNGELVDMMPLLLPPLPPPPPPVEGSLVTSMVAEAKDVDERVVDVRFRVELERNEVVERWEVVKLPMLPVEVGEDEIGLAGVGEAITITVPPKVELENAHKELLMVAVEFWVDMIFGTVMRVDTVGWLMKEVIVVTGVRTVPEKLLLLLLIPALLRLEAAGVLLWMELKNGVGT